MECMNVISGFLQQTILTWCFHRHNGQFSWHTEYWICKMYFTTFVDTKKYFSYIVNCILKDKLIKKSKGTFH